MSLSCSIKMSSLVQLTIFLAWATILVMSQPAAKCPIMPGLASVEETQPGCPCLFPRGFQGTLNVTTALLSRPTTGLCPAGYRCSFLGKTALATHYIIDEGLANTLGDKRTGICVPCVLGEYCPRGTLEKTETDLQNCGSMASALLQATNLSDPEPGQETNSASPWGLRMSSLEVACFGFNPCPAGSYCPDPSRRLDCSPGSFCPLGSTSEITCQMDELLQKRPLKAITPPPDLLFIQMVKNMKPFGGNACPDKSTIPYGECPAGYYCPEVNMIIPCRKGFYCPKSVEKEIRCPFGTTCNEERQSAPKYSILALVLLLLAVIVFALMVEAYNRFAQRRLQAKIQEENLQEVLQSLGYSELQRAPPAKPTGSFRGPRGPDPLRPPSSFTWSSSFYRGPPRQELAPEGEQSARLLASEERSVPVLAKPLVVKGAAHKHQGRLPGFADITPRLRLEFRNLVLTLPGGKRALDNVSGYYPHSQMTALMGPSGCGKSSLLTVLAGKPTAGKREGVVKVYNYSSSDRAGVPVSKMRYCTGFVPQDDIVHETLTVHENLQYAARLRLPSGTRRSQQHDVTNSVQTMLGLVHIQHSVVGSVEKRGISGGQRKRVNIGMELVAKPSLLFLDEPTSGLDSAVAHDVLAAMARLAEAGMNIICVIHQPRYAIFEMFDMVQLLGPGGRTVYLGPATCALDYFNFLGFRLQVNENPADYFLDVISGTISREGDEDFVPSELFTLWQECGVPWVKSLSGQGPEPDWQEGEGSPSQSTYIDIVLDHKTVQDVLNKRRRSHTESRDAETGMHPPQRLYWPWRPKELEAVQQKFTMLDIDQSDSLDYQEFEEFWSGMKHILSREEYDVFLHQLIRDFDIKEGGVITRDDFMEIVKRKLIALHGEDPDLQAKATRFQAVPSVVPLPPVPRGPPSIPGGRGRTSASPRGPLMPQAPSATSTPMAPGDSPRHGPSFFTPLASTPSFNRHRQVLQQHSKLAHALPPPGGFAKQATRRVQTMARDAANAAVGAIDDIRQAAGRNVGGRSLPNIVVQTYIVLARCGKKAMNAKAVLFADLLLTVLVAFALGMAQGHISDVKKITLWWVITIMGYGILNLVISLRTFGGDYLIYNRREASGGLLSVAYFMGHQLWDLVYLALTPALFFAVFYAITFPSVDRTDFYLVLMAVSWTTYGIGYVVSILVDKGTALPLATALGLVLGGVINGVEPSKSSLGEGHPMLIFYSLSYTRWAMEALYIKLLGEPESYQAHVNAATLANFGFCGLDRYINVRELQNPNTTEISLQYLLEDEEFMDLVLQQKGSNLPEQQTQLESQVLLKMREAPDDRLRTAATMYGYYRHPEAVRDQCRTSYYTALLVLFVMGVALRVAFILIVQWRVKRGRRRG